MSEMELPKIELSYETIIHKKVHSNQILLIPLGAPSLLWINKNGAYLINYNNKNNKEKKRLSYHSSLSNGTMFYGVLFKYKNVNFFVIEDLLYYKGKSYSSQSFSNKLSIIGSILEKEIQQQPAKDNNDIIIGLPVMTDNINIKMIENLPYKIKYIQFRNFQKQNGNQRFQLPLQKYLDSVNEVVTFLIKPDVKTDIYHLYKEDKYIDVAYIPDYKTSVMMNKLFRNIKENSNLDLLEESDDEEEEIIVYLDREYNMNCKYNKKFKKWVPICLENNK
jgi:hypothetical protein